MMTSHTLLCQVFHFQTLWSRYVVSTQGVHASSLNLVCKSHPLGLIVQSFGSWTWCQQNSKQLKSFLLQFFPGSAHISGRLTGLLVFSARLLLLLFGHFFVDCYGTCILLACFPLLHFALSRFQCPTVSHTRKSQVTDIYYDKICILNIACLHEVAVKLICRQRAKLGSL